MDLYVASRMGALFGLLFLVSLGSPLGNNSSPTPNAESRYFSEGGGLLSDPAPASKRTHEIIARKDAVNSTKVAAGLSNSNVSEPSKTKERIMNSKNETQREHYEQTSTSEILPPKVLNASSSTKSLPILNKSSTVSTVELKSEATTIQANVSATPAPKKKSKPGLTFDVDDLPRDANGKVIVTKEDLVGSGPSFDYVVPIVIAMLAVPFVAVIGTFLYKKGRDFWDRRHYRRMDFLIDGMYND